MGNGSDSSPSHSNSTPTPPPGYTLEVPPHGTVIVGDFDNPVPASNGPDQRLTVETQLALERGPWAIRKHIPIQNVQVFDAQLPNGETSLVDGRNPIAGVEEGNTRDINVYDKEAFEGSGELANHEAEHFIQNMLPADQQTKIPQGDPSDPYKELRFTDETLRAIRAKGDTFSKHSREGRATIIQKYQAVKDKVAKMSLQDQADFLASRGKFKGSGNAELMATYQPYLEDQENVNLPGDKVVQQTPMKSPPIPPLGYPLEIGDPTRVLPQPPSGYRLEK